MGYFLEIFGLFWSFPVQTIVHFTYDNQKPVIVDKSKPPTKLKCIKTEHHHISQKKASQIIPYIIQKNEHQIHKSFMDMVTIVQKTIVQKTNTIVQKISHRLLHYNIV